MAFLKTEDRVYEKRIFNQDSQEDFSEARIVGGSPNGLINYNSKAHPWARQIYRNMIDRTWFVNQINITKDKTNYTQLTEAEKRTYDLVLAQLIMNDSIQSNQLADRVNCYITSPVVNACLIRQAWEECLIEGTEVLTADGFVDFRNLTKHHLVANYCENGKIYFNYPKNITMRPHSGTMYRFHQRNYEQIVTPNHRMVKKMNNYPSRLGWRGNSYEEDQIIIEEAHACSVHNYNLPVAGYHEYGRDLVFTPLDALAVAYQADGCLVNKQTEPTKNGYCYQYSFRRQDKIDRMQLLINLAGCKFTRTGPNARGYTHFYIWVDRKFDKNFDWVNLIDKHTVWCHNFIEELKYWDGSDRDKQGRGRRDNYSLRKGILFTNTNLNAINKVQAIAAMVGAQSGLYHMPLVEGRLQSYQLHIVLGKDYKVGRDVKKEPIEYYGTVYCCTVDTGMIICRYNGNVFVTGNCNHSDSYTTLAEDVAQDVDYIYNLHKHDTELQLKNKSVEDMYLQLYQGNEPTVEDLLMVFVANQILEELVFPGGFAAMLSLGHKMPGTKDHIAEIMKDETLSHVPLFRSIFRTTLDENFGGKVPGSVMNRARDLIMKMTEAEIRWTEYATQGLMGFSPRSIETFVKSKANSVCRNLKLEPLYGVAEDATSNPLLHLLKKHLSDGETSTKTNFFEGNVVDYSKDSLDVDI